MGKRNPSYLEKVTLTHGVRGKKAGWEAGAGCGRAVRTDMQEASR